MAEVKVRVQGGDDDRYEPTVEDVLAMFMRFGHPEGRYLAYPDLEPDTVVFKANGGNPHIITAIDVRLLQQYLRDTGFTGGKSRLDELMAQMPTTGGEQ